MIRLMHRLALFALLAWLPLQASAMPWLSFKCEQHGSGMHQHAAHGQHSDGAGDVAHGVGDDGMATADAHDCCHHFSVAVLPMRPLYTAGLPGSAGELPQVHSYSFFPELPKRPPLAGLV